MGFSTLISHIFTKWKSLNKNILYKSLFISVSDILIIYFQVVTGSEWEARVSTHRQAVGYSQDSSNVRGLREWLHMGETVSSATNLLPVHPLLRLFLLQPLSPLCQLNPVCRLQFLSSPHCCCHVCLYTFQLSLFHLFCCKLRQNLLSFFLLLLQFVKLLSAVFTKVGDHTFISFETYIHSMLKKN